MPAAGQFAEELGSSLGQLPGVAVRVGTVRVGEVIGVFLRGSRAIGLEVVGSGGARFFLPWFAARFDADGVRIESAFLLVDTTESYERHGALPVRDPGPLASLVVGPDGVVVSTSASTSSAR